MNEIETLQAEILALKIKLAPHNQEAFFDGMKNEIVEQTKALSYIEENYKGLKERQKTGEKMLREVAISMLETGQTMAATVPSWELPACPLDIDEYDHTGFQNKVYMLHDFNDYMRAIREINPRLLRTYYPYSMYFLNEINRAREFYMADSSRTDIWKGCINLRKRLYILRQSLDDVIDKKE